jgi:hypothetical protein
MGNDNDFWGNRPRGMGGPQPRPPRRRSPADGGSPSGCLMALAVPVLALLAVLALAGCGAAEQELHQGDTRGVVETIEIERADGRKIECAVLNVSKGGGISCDWATK